MSNFSDLVNGTRHRRRWIKIVGFEQKPELHCFIDNTFLFKNFWKQAPSIEGELRYGGWYLTNYILLQKAENLPTRIDHIFSQPHMSCAADEKVIITNWRRWGLCVLLCTRFLWVCQIFSQSNHQWNSYQAPVKQKPSNSSQISHVFLSQYISDFQRGPLISINPW